MSSGQQCVTDVKRGWPVRQRRCVVPSRYRRPLGHHGLSVVDRSTQPQQPASCSATRFPLSAPRGRQRRASATVNSLQHSWSHPRPGRLRQLRIQKHRHPAVAACQPSVSSPVPSCPTVFSMVPLPPVSILRSSTQRLALLFCFVAIKLCMKDWKLIKLREDLTNVKLSTQLKQILVSFQTTANEINLSQFCFSASHVWNKMLKQFRHRRDRSELLSVFIIKLFVVSKVGNSEVVNALVLYWQWSQYVASQHNSWRRTPSDVNWWRHFRRTSSAV